MTRKADLDEQLFERYDFHLPIGRGLYGVVWQARDVELETAVAIKKINRAFGSRVDAERTYREVTILQLLKDGCNGLCNLQRVIKSPKDDHLYLVMELYDADLQKFLKQGVVRQLQRELIFYQILRGLKYIHSAGIVHRDIKPANICLTMSKEIKIVDFGLARPIAAVGTAAMTDYIGCRWYRAPELHLGSKEYGAAVDMWAAGCIWAELLAAQNQPLVPATSSLDAVQIVVELCGTPLEGDIIALRSAYARSMLAAYRTQSPMDFAIKFAHQLGKDARKNVQESLDMLRCMITFSPLKRITSTECIQHPAVGSFRNPDDEPIAFQKVSLPLHRNNARIPDFRAAIYKEYVTKLMDVEDSADEEDNV